MNKLPLTSQQQVVDFDQSTTTVKEERNKTLLLDESDKLLRSILLQMHEMKENWTESGCMSEICPTLP